MMITKPNYAFEMQVIQSVPLNIRLWSINHRRATAAAASAPVHMDPLPKVEGWPFVSTVSAVVEVGADDAAGVGVPVIWPEQMSATEVDALDSSSRAQPAMMRHGEALSTMAWTLEHAHWTSVREQPCSERALVRHSMEHLGSWSISSVRESIARAEVTRVAKKRKRMVGDGF